MAQVILSAVGTAVAGPIGGAIGLAAGAAIDTAAINALTPARRIGPRIPELRLSGAAEGAPMAAVFGRARVAGQVIWAARFKERWIEARSGGSKGAKTTSAAYSLSFAVAVCEGPIDGLGRVWADGKPLDMAGVVMRVHTGAEDQLPDPLIAAVEGPSDAGGAPAYRGTAYVVFEDLPLGAYGNRPPQLSFEVFHRPRAGAPGLEERLKGVCLIPGAGEFVYATDIVLRRDGLTRTTAETLNNGEGRPDLVVSLDQLQAQLPNVQEVTLVVAWFGDDLRCGSCAIRPKVEQAAKATIPFDWRVNGIDRADAAVVSMHGDGLAYGGTPADRAVLQAIAELKRRGLRVTLYPFVMMDVPAGNTRPDPYGGAAQGAYPWRGRITCHPAAGRPGSPDKTAAASAQVSAFFGAATAGQFGVDDGLPTYGGPAGDWGLRRMLLHYAKLAQLAGGVDGFILGSELRGLTTVRDGASSYPAVTALKSLAGQVRSLLGPATQLGYAADWSEYFGHQPPDGSGDVHFHLDPLWSDANIDFVGIDFYPPMADWRDGDDHLDAERGGPHDVDYLRANLTGGEGFDWFYASDAARTAQTRTPITDGAYGEPWVYRPKDLLSWWSRPHFNRPGGVRSGTATAWIPKSKPLRLVEFGCGAVDKGANAPNLFVDAKSAESALPPFSDATRDEVGQRRALEAVLAHLADPATNPVSPAYGGPMIDAASAWCWDARPFPDFPARSAVWADGPNWTLGHWLNGRSGIAPLPELITALAERAGVAIDPGEAGGAVVGYVVDRPMQLRDALAPLLEAFALDPVERQAGVVLASRSGVAALALGDDDLAWPEDRDAPVAAARTLAAPPQTLRLRFIDAARDYQTGSAIVRRETGEGGADLDAPLVLAAAEARAVAERLLAATDPREVTVHLAPLAALRPEPGDRLALDGSTWRVTRVDLDEHPRVQLAPVVEAVRVGGDLDWSPAPPRETSGPPVLHVLDLPGQADERPLVAVAAAPWRGFDVHAGVGVEALRVRATAAVPATVGVTLSDLPAGPLHRFDRATRLTVRLEGAAPTSRDRSAVLAGANALAVRSVTGEWEIVQYLTAEPVAEDVWTLSGLLRGQAGSDPAMTALTPAGAAVVVLDEALVRADLAPAERGLPLVWRAAPAGGPASGPSMSEAMETWRGLSARPWSPAHLRVKTQGGDKLVTWIRRARVAGDGWDAEVPLGEEREVYRVEILDGETVVRTVETTVPAFTYAAAQRAADFPAGPTGALAVRVAQGSALYGWGAPSRTLL
ncbi:baseplate multidomain protein megatron [Caulobacter soli]|uniref:baseplate multidomain protein megatron n=1 Tax=Caulobacter soli TaxID=2708539 RepID=UPI0013EAFD40|nr:glycoside hydrolase/phage tail family protein [Caulobacter soli]